MTMESEINEAMLRGLAKEQSYLLNKANDVLDEARKTIGILSTALQNSMDETNMWKSRYMNLMITLDATHGGHPAKGKQDNG